MSLTTMYPAMNNSPRTVLTAAITATDTELTLDDASVLPSAPNLLVLGTGDDAEIVSYTTISGNEVSGLVRGVNGTIAGAWPINTIVARNFTAADHEAFRENILDLDSRKIEGIAWGDITGTLATQTDLSTALAGKSDTSHNHDSRYYTETEMDSKLAEKAPLASPALTGTPTSTTAAVNTVSTQIATTAFVASQAPMKVTGTASAGNGVTITDSRINSEHWKVPERGITFTPSANVTNNGTWTTNPTNHTITLSNTFTGSTSIVIDMYWYQ